MGGPKFYFKGRDVICLLTNFMKQNNIHCYSVYSNDVISNFNIELKEKKISKENSFSLACKLSSCTNNNNPS